MNVKTQWFKRCIYWVLSLCLCATLLIGCTSNKPVVVDTQRTLAEQIHPGDMVTVTMQDGKERTFRVIEVRDNELVGHKRTVNIADVKDMSVVKVNAGKTFAAGLGGFAVGIMTVAFIVVIAIAGA